MKRNLFACTLAGCALVAGPLSAAPLGTAFRYQGYLERPAGTPVNETCDFRVGLWNAPLGGGQPGNPPQTTLGVSIVAGAFTMALDFGDGAIDGTNARWLAIEVQCPGDAGFVLLAPRVELNPVPHALALPGLYTQQNAASPNIIGGYAGNIVSAGVDGATVSGGGNFGFIQRITDNYGTIGGGYGNRAGDQAGTIDDARAATVSGGIFNEASGAYSSVGGGWGNIATGGSSTIVGGESNNAAGLASAVLGGSLNRASGDRSAAAGFRAKADHDGTFVWADSFGNDFASTGPDQFLVRASGGMRLAGVPRPYLQGVAVNDTTIPDDLILQLHGGRVGIGLAGTPTAPLEVVGSYVQEFGQVVVRHALNEATYGWWGAGTNSVVFAANNVAIGGGGIEFRVGTGAVTTQVMLLHNGGRVGINQPTPTHPVHVGTTSFNGNGAHLTVGGVWTNGSDRESKENFEPIDKQSVLEKVVQLPITRWQYKGEDDSIHHIGPVAQDFHAAFGLGGTDTHIGTLDADGVALAAIQGLHELVREKDCQIEELRSELANLKEMILALRAQDGGRQ